MAKRGRLHQEKQCIILNSIDWIHPSIRPQTNYSIQSPLNKQRDLYLFANEWIKYLSVTFICGHCCWSSIGLYRPNEMDNGKRCPKRSNVLKLLHQRMWRKFRFLLCQDWQVFVAKLYIGPSTLSVRPIFPIVPEKTAEKTHPTSVQSLDTEAQALSRILGRIQPKHQVFLVVISIWFYLPFALS